MVVTPFLCFDQYAKWQWHSDSAMYSRRRIYTYHSLHRIYEHLLHEDSELKKVAWQSNEQHPFAIGNQKHVHSC